MSVFPCSPDVRIGEPVRLGAHPNGLTLVYSQGHIIVLRSLDSPMSNVDFYFEHQATVITAKVSSSGFYVAFGDVNGHVRIWDATQPTHILKLMFKL